MQLDQPRLGRLQCACGRAVKPYDFWLGRRSLTVVCGQCHRTLLTIDLIPDEPPHEISHVY